MESLEDLFSLIKTLPEEAKMEFMAIISELNNENITTVKAVDLIDDLLDRHTPKIVQ